MFLFLLGIILRAFRISWMRNDRFNIKTNIFLRFPSERFRSSRFTSLHCTSSPFLSLRFLKKSPLSVVYFPAVFLFKSVCFASPRLSSAVQSSPVQSSPVQIFFLIDDVMSLPVSSSISSLLIVFHRAVWKHLNGVALFF